MLQKIHIAFHYVVNYTAVRLHDKNVKTKLNLCMP
jgi:hypothetical protein